MFCSPLKVMFYLMKVVSNTINTVIKRRKQAYFKENAEMEYNGNDELEKEDFSSYNVTYKDLLQVSM